MSITQLGSLHRTISRVHRSIHTGWVHASACELGRGANEDLRPDRQIQDKAMHKDKETMPMVTMPRDKDASLSSLSSLS